MGRQRLDVLLKDIESLKLNEGYTLSIPIVFDAITVNLCLNWVHHLTAMLINIQMLKSKNRPFGYLFAVLLLDEHVTYVYGLLLSAVLDRGDISWTEFFPVNKWFKCKLYFTVELVEIHFRSLRWREKSQKNKFKRKKRLCKLLKSHKNRMILRILTKYLNNPSI